MIIKTFQILVVILILSPGISKAQRYRTQPKQITIEQLPRIPIDTVDVKNSKTKLVIYSNNTWEYYHSDVDYMFDSPIYKSNWDTTQVFAYKNIELKDLPETIELNLVGETSKFKSPVVGPVFSKYGPRRRTIHNGVDISMKRGEPLYAAFDGKVRYSKYNSGGFGYLVIVRHPNGLESWYAHLSKLNVNVNEYVKAGQIIGYAGSTGRSRGVHLHFELRYCDQTFDPEFLVDFDEGLLRYKVFVLERSFFNIKSRATEILEEDDDDYIQEEAKYVNIHDVTDVENITSAVKDSKVVTVSESKEVYHTVKNGDILSRIASKYGVSVNQICRLNKLPSPDKLRLGQKLRIK